LVGLLWCINFSDDKNSSRQIAFSLCSVQNQFRALGFRDIRAFGATLFKHEFQFYVLEWVGDEVVSASSIQIFFKKFTNYIWWLGCGPYQAHPCA
jgi:hypothetical protein